MESTKPSSELEKQKVRKFDESQKDVSDVIIVVQSSKFYVLRKYLASQSSFFKTLFIENSSVFKKPVIALPGIDPDDFHYFLEVLYGESAIDNSNVEKVLFLADKFDSPLAKRKCEEFLLEKSMKNKEKKQQLANGYHFDNRSFTCAIANVNFKTKQFILKHSYPDVTSFKEGVDYYSEWEDYFNVNWYMSVKRVNNYLGCYVCCVPIAPSDKWSIQTNLQFKVVGRNKNDYIKTINYCYKEYTGRGFPQFLGWEKMEEVYLMDGNLTVEAKVEIIETTGLGKERMRNSDDSNVEGVLFLADILDSPTAKRRCEEFLLKESKRSFEAKHRLANRYCLKNWNLTCAIANANSKTKQFILKHSFQNVSSFKERVNYYSTWEDYFNVRWYMSVKRINNVLDFYAYCKPIAPSDKWSIQMNLEVKVVGINQNDVIKSRTYRYEKCTGCGIPQFLEWDKMEKEYLIDGNLKVEAKVTIIETSGLGKEKIRRFDEFQKDVSDVILVVRDKKFYASKSLLAEQSIYFKAILFGKASESKESEVLLKDVDPNDFHYFLEVLHGEPAIDDSTVEGILMVADKYDTPMVAERCQEFLLKSSKKRSLKKSWNLLKIFKSLLSENCYFYDNSLKCVLLSYFQLH
ncbi:unnamed protein product [Caenorhabditis nigoni]